MLDNLLWEYSIRSAVGIYHVRLLMSFNICIEFWVIDCWAITFWCAILCISLLNIGSLIVVVFHGIIGFGCISCWKGVL